MAAALSLSYGVLSLTVSHCLTPTVADFFQLCHCMIRQNTQPSLCQPERGKRQRGEQIGKRRWKRREKDDEPPCGLIQSLRFVVPQPLARGRKKIKNQQEKKTCKSGLASKSPKLAVGRTRENRTFATISGFLWVDDIDPSNTNRCLSEGRGKKTKRKKKSPIRA